MFTGVFVQRDGPGGAVRGVGGGIVMGLVGTPGTATIGGGSRGRCTPAVLFTRGWPGRSRRRSGSRERIGTSRSEGPRSWRSRRSRGQGLVTVGVRVAVPCRE